MANSHAVFITGGTGYMGQRLISELLRRGHRVQALARQQSREKLPPGCIGLIGDALDFQTYVQQVRAADTFVHFKAEQFRKIDLVSVREAVAAALQAGVNHVIYVSVARPAPIMKAYQEVRAECGQMIRDSGLRATIIRPWYVLGPGHRWPYLLVPVYRLLEYMPPTREGALRLGLVTVQQMTSSLVRAVEHPPSGIRLIGVGEIRRAAMERTAAAPTP